MKTIFTSLFAALILAGCAGSDLKKDSSTNSEIPALDTSLRRTTDPAVILAPATKELKGICRKNVNESGSPLKKSAIKRLQNSYVFEGDRVTWFVKHYKDTACKKPRGGSRLEFQCDKDPFNQKATCKQISEASYTKGTWQNTKMVDHAGSANVLTMSYHLKTGQDNSATLYSTSISDEGEEEKEVLSF